MADTSFFVGLAHAPFILFVISRLWQSMHSSFLFLFGSALSNFDQYYTMGWDFDFELVFEFAEVFLLPEVAHFLLARQAEV